MCGVTGFWSKRPQFSPREREAALRKMTGAIRHRGPDAKGFWRDDEAGIAIGHRRLSILELSEAGAQPMRSASGRLVIAFNGEIYNHLSIRKELERSGFEAEWRGHSDTETLVEAIEFWGLERALPKLAGMFAFALWDRRDGTLSLARDRMGEKPMYFGRAAGGLIFGSEIKALRRFPGFDATIDEDAFDAYLRRSCVPAPLTIFRSARKLPPGGFVVFVDPDAALDARPASYWSFARMAEAAVEDRPALTVAQAADRLEPILTEVVQSHMLSDVPLGAFLSGGVDSSLVTSLMRAGGSRPRTFSIGFSTGRMNEAPYAKAVADHLGTDHTELMVTEEDALDLVPRLASIYDEPFADSSQVPTALLCRLARAETTVVLTGDGGDEIFGGYNRHVIAPGLWAKADRAPRSLRKLLGPATAAAQRFGSGGRAEGLTALAVKLGLPTTAVDKFAKFGGAIARAEDFADFYREIASTWADAAAVRPRRSRSREPLDPLIAIGDDRERLMAWDSVTYLPDDILVKVDRAAMAASLETRAPLLDVRVVEAAWRLPPDAKIAGRTGKAPLREILYRHVPRELVDRPKQGFAIPLDDWLRGRLRDWAEPQLTARALERSGLFEAAPVQKLWNDHLAGRSNDGARLWTVLMAQSWLADLDRDLSGSADA